jgi:Mor family transcriptional regulator
MTITRNEQIIAAYRDGKTITSLAAEWGVSRQRINQLVRAACVPHRHPGMAETKRLTARAG